MEETTTITTELPAAPSLAAEAWQPAPQQQLLFDELAFFLQNDQAAADHYHKHTGRRLEQTLARAIVERRVLGMSERSVAELFHVSRNTVSALMERAESSGEVEPLKARLSRRLGLAVELLSEQLVDDIRNDRLPAQTRPIALGILLDKKLLLDGDPTVRTEVRIEAALTPADFTAMLDKMKRAQVTEIEATVDTESTAQPPPEPHSQGLA